MSDMSGSVNLIDIDINSFNYLINETDVTFWNKNKFDNYGKPNHNITDVSISNDTLTSLSLTLPEKIDANTTLFGDHPSLLNGISDLIIGDQETDISLTFIKEGAGYKNSIGYYFYILKTETGQLQDTLKLSLDVIESDYIGWDIEITGGSGNTLKDVIIDYDNTTKTFTTFYNLLTVTDITSSYKLTKPQLITNDVNSNGFYYKPTIIFPNTSMVNSGGSLTTGKTRLLKGNLPNGKFKNIRVGFFLIPNGWKNKTNGVVYDSKIIKHSTPQFNSIFDKTLPSNHDTQIGIQTALFMDNQNIDDFYICFEDISRIKTNCDNDFNDLIIKLHTTPSLNSTILEQLPVILPPTTPTNNCSVYRLKADYNNNSYSWETSPNNPGNNDCIKTSMFTWDSGANGVDYFDYTGDDSVVTVTIKSGVTANITTACSKQGLEHHSAIISSNKQEATFTKVNHDISHIELLIDTCQSNSSENTSNNSSDITLVDWMQCGSSIRGTFEESLAGSSVSINDSGNIVAFGAPGNGISQHGYVEVYQYGLNISNQFSRLGNRIESSILGDYHGWYISLDDTGHRIAIGVKEYESTGCVKLYDYDVVSTTWIQVGQTIVGQLWKESSGWCVSLSGSGQTLAIGAPNAHNETTKNGIVRLYKYDTTMNQWVQSGQDIIGNTDDKCGFSVSMNTMGDKVAIGFPGLELNGYKGMVRIYEQNTSGSWVQLGQKIIESTDYAWSNGGHTVSLNGLGDIVAVGTPEASDIDNNNSSLLKNKQDSQGFVKLYKYNDQIPNDWSQLGESLVGYKKYNKFGTSLDLNTIGDIIAIGAPINKNNETKNKEKKNAGYVKFYKYESNNWNTYGNDIYGQSKNDQSGHSLAINGSGDKVVIGAPRNKKNGKNNFGNVRVFCYPSDETSNTQMVTPTVVPLTTNNTTPVVTGTALSDYTITCFVNNILYTENDGNLIDNLDDTWSLTIPQSNALLDGIYDVILTATDQSGNKLQNTSSDDLTIKTTVPTIPTVVSKITNDSTPTLLGTFDSIDSLTVTVNNVVYTIGDENLIDNENNTWTLTIPSENALSDGVYNVNAIAIDQAGNTSTDVTTNELTINTVPPPIPTVIKLITNNKTPIINGSAASNAFSMTVVVNGQTYTRGDGHLIDNGDNGWNLTIPVNQSLLDGTYDVVVTVTDSIGNSSTDATTNDLIIKTTSPTPPTITPLHTNITRPTLVGTCDTNYTLIVNLNNQTYTENDGHLSHINNTWTLILPDSVPELSDGVYNVEAIATDVAGNSSVDLTTNELIIDTVNQTIPTINTLITKNKTPTLTGIVNSSDTLTVQLNNNTYTNNDGYLTIYPTNTWTLIVPNEHSLQDGIYDVVATATDSLGNVSVDTTSNELTVDTIKPIMPTVENVVTDDTTPFIVGTFDSTTSLNVTINNVTYSTGDSILIDNGNDTWSLTIPSPLLIDTYDVFVESTDKAGNTSDATGSLVITILPTVNSQITNDTTPIITGTSLSVNTTSVLLNSVVYSEETNTLTDNGDDTWSLQVSDINSLSDGTYGILVTSIDSLGNESKNTIGNDLIINTVNSFTPTVVPIITKEFNPTVTGTVDYLSTITVQCNGRIYTPGDGNLIVNSDNTWSLTFPEGHELLHCAYDVLVTSVDNLGNTSKNNPDGEIMIKTDLPKVPTVNSLITSDTTPTLIGTADYVGDLSGRFVGTLFVTVNNRTYIYPPEGEDTSLQSLPNNTWTLTIPNEYSLSDGTYSVFVISVDAAGNSSNDITANELIVDTVNPTIPTVLPLITNDTTPSLVGTSDFNNTLSVTVNTIVYYETDSHLTKNENNTWVLEIPIEHALQGGIYTVLATAIDSAGNKSHSVTVNQLEIDLIPPTIPTINQLITNNHYPTLTGTIDSTDSILVKVNDVVYHFHHVIQDGNNWSLTVESMIPDGIYQVQVTATDSVGNTSVNEIANDLIIDTINPTPPTINSLTTNNTTPTIIGTFEENTIVSVDVNSITYTVNDGHLTTTDTLWTLSIPTALSVGYYDIFASSVDLAGNQSLTTTGELLITNDVNVTPTVVPLVTNTFTPTIRGTASSNKSLTVEINTIVYTKGDGHLTDNGNDTWKLTIPIESSLTDGTYDILVVSDTNSTDVTTNELIIITSLPEIPTVVSQITNNTTPTIVGTADSTNDLSVTVNGISYKKNSSNLNFTDSTNWTLSIPIGNKLDDGIYDVLVESIDIAKNNSKNSPNGELTIDTVVPTVPTVNPLTTGLKTPTLTGTADSTDTLFVTINNIDYIIGDYLSQSETNTWTLIIPSSDSLETGNYSVLVKTVDKAGNESININSTEDVLFIRPIPTVTPLITKNRTPVITGTAETGYSLSATVNGKSYNEGDGQLVDNGDNTWTLTITDELDDNTYDVDIIAHDAEQITYQNDTDGDLIIINTSPDNPILTPLLTNSIVPTITGTAIKTDISDLLQVTVNGVNYIEAEGQLVWLSNDVWYLNIPTVNALAHGNYSPIVIVSDKAGNTTSKTFENELIVDLIPPTIPTVNYLQTGDTTPVITGTADSIAEDTLEILIDGVNYTKGDSYLTDNGDNTWTLSIPSGNELVNGDYHVNVTVIDPAGNESINSVKTDLTIIIEYPSIPTVNSLTTNIITPTITGTADSNSDLEIQLNSITYSKGDGNLIDNGDDTWSLTIPMENSLTNNTYNVVVKSTNSYNNSTFNKTKGDLIVDTIPPTTPFIYSLTTNNKTPTLTGTADSVDSLKVIVNGVLYEKGITIIDNGTNFWSLTIPIENSLTIGTYNVQATATDNAGNESTSFSDIVINNETVSPSIIPLTTNNTTPTIYGIADKMDSIIVKINEISYTVNDYLLHTGDLWNLTLPNEHALLDGTYLVELSSTLYPMVVETLIIKTVEPSEPTADLLRTNDSTPTVTGTADISNLTVTIDGIEYSTNKGDIVQDEQGNWTLTVKNTLDDGFYDVVVVSTDDVGNSSQNNTFNDLEINTSTPIVPTVQPLITKNQQPRLYGTVNYDYILELTLNSITYTSVTSQINVSTNNIWFFDVPVELLNGSYDILLTVTDVYGNQITNEESNKLNALRIDTVNPTIPTVTPLITNNKMPTIYGTGDSIDTISVVVNSKTYGGTTVVRNDNVWSVTIPFEHKLNDGTYDVSVTATDTVGNTSTNSTTGDLIINTIIPIIPTMIPLITNNTKPLLTGTAENNTSVELIIDNKTYFATNENGQWQVQLNTSLSDGVYNVQLKSSRLTNSLNFSTNTIQNGLTIDTNPPIEPTIDYQKTSNILPVITGTIGEHDLIDIQLNGFTYTDADSDVSRVNTRWTLSVPPGLELDHGVYTIIVKATDLAGNTTTTIGTNQLEIDTINPVIPTVTKLVTNNKTPIIEGTFDSVNTISVLIKQNETVILNSNNDGQWEVDNTNNGIWSLSIPESNPLEDGIYDILVTTKDTFNRTSQNIPNNDLIIDTVLPTIPTVTNQKTFNTLPTICGTADADTIIHVQLNETIYTNEEYGIISIENDNTWCFTVPESDILVPSMYNVTISSTDLAGNISTNDAPCDLEILTKPELTHTILNQSDLIDPTFIYTNINGIVIGSIGHQMKYTVSVSIPPGTIKLKSIDIHFSLSHSELIHSDSTVNVQFDDQLTYINDDGLTSIDLQLTPDSLTYSYKNTIRFDINKSFTNNDIVNKFIQFDYLFAINDSSSNIESRLINTNYSLQIGYVSNQIEKIEEIMTEYPKSFYIVEPSISIRQELKEVPLHKNDSFKIDVILSVHDNNFVSFPFNPDWYYDIDTTDIDTTKLISDITVPDNWTVSLNGTRVSFTYENITKNYLLKDTDYIFTIKLTFNNNTNLNYGSSYKNLVVANCTSVDKTKHITFRNYTVDNTLPVYIEESIETHKFGVAIEDALDFDYDYCDLVFNVLYEIYRNKKGIKKLVIDYHIVARGAGYDHTLGVFCNNLKTRSDGMPRQGTWNVMWYDGPNDVVINNNNYILDYLDKHGMSNTLDNLIFNEIPMIISCKNSFPPDGAKPGESHSTNAADRLITVPDWTKPVTVRLILEFEENNELITNGNVFEPYIDVRNPFIINTHPVKYSNTEYKVYLNSIIMGSSKYFTYKDVYMSYNKFPRMLITPVDFAPIEDSGGTLGYPGLIFAYTELVDYLTNGNYPSVDSMRSMTNIRQRIVDMSDPNYWTKHGVNQEYVMKVFNYQYQLIGLPQIKNKELLNEYHNFHIFKLGLNVYTLLSNIHQFVPINESQSTILIDSIQTTLNTYNSSLSSPIIHQVVGTNDSLYLHEYDRDNNIYSIKSNTVIQSEFINKQIIKLKTSISGLIAIEHKIDSEFVYTIRGNSNGDQDSWRVYDTSYSSDASRKQGNIICSDTTHDVSIHNIDRDIYDVCYYKDNIIMSIDTQNTIVVSGNNASMYNVSGIQNPIKIDCSDSAIVILTSSGDVFLLNEQNLEPYQLFPTKTIISLSISSKNILALTTTYDVFMYTIDSDITTSEPIETDVKKMSCSSDWAAFLKINGQISTLATSGTLPDLTINNIETTNSVYTDIYVNNTSLIVYY
jgi:methionine-rich copper-binding protein CopC